MATARKRQTGGTRRAKTAAEKMRAFRARMRAKGFKLVQTWVPDVTNPAFIERVNRDIEAVRGTKSEREAIEFIEALAEDVDEWK